jgi:hypothetical protein
MRDEENIINSTEFNLVCCLIAVSRYLSEETSDNCSKSKNLIMDTLSTFYEKLYD